MNAFRQEIKSAVKSAFAGRCSNDNCLNMATEAHHAVPNTKANQSRWRLYLQSPMNLRPLCYDCHHNKPLPKKPNAMLLDIYERWLESLK